LEKAKKTQRRHELAGNSNTARVRKRKTVEDQKKDAVHTDLKHTTPKKKGFCETSRKAQKTNRNNWREKSSKKPIEASNCWGVV